LVFDYGESFFRNKRVVDLVIEKMPVTISLGLWTTLMIYFISIPLGIAKAVRDGSRFDVSTSTTLIVLNAIPGFVFALLLGVLFTGSLPIEVIFSLDVGGLLGFEAAINRDYPIMFGTLYFFGLIGLVMGILGDLMYTVVDPRIDFEARG